MKHKDIEDNDEENSDKNDDNFYETKHSPGRWVKVPVKVIR